MSYQPPSILPQLAAAPTIVSPPMNSNNGQFPPVPVIGMNDDPMTGGNAPAKMFVGGLPQSVTQDSLREYFGRFGRISEAFVLMDEASGRSRGFGFVTFENPGSLQRVLNSRPHYLDGKCVDCKHAVLKGQNAGGTRQETPSTGPQQQQQQIPTPNTGSISTNGLQTVSQPVPTTTAGANGGTWSRTFKPARSDNNPTPPAGSSASASGSSGTLDSSRDGGDEDDELFLTGGGKSYLALSGDKWLEDCAEADERKIFVGGLPDVTPAEFASFFEHFGPVADAMVMFDRKRRRQRGFGFITFATSEGVANALQFNRHPVKGKLAEVKKAHPLVLQKARAPAKKEREAAQQQLDKRSSPNATAASNCNSGKRKNSVTAAGPPWTATSTKALGPQTGGTSASAQDYTTWSCGKKARNDIDEALTDPFASMAEPIAVGLHQGQQQQQQAQQHQQQQQQAQINDAACRSRFPSAPWNEDLEKRRFGYEDDNRIQAAPAPAPQFMTTPAAEYPTFYGAPHAAEIPAPLQFAAPGYGYHPHHQYQQQADPYTSTMLGGNPPSAAKYYGEEVAGYGPTYEAPLFSKR